MAKSEALLSIRIQLDDQYETHEFIKEELLVSVGAISFIVIAIASSLNYFVSDYESALIETLFKQ